VKKAYKEKALQYHPDKLPPGEQHDDTRFREVHAAYELLKELHKDEL